MLSLKNPNAMKSSQNKIYNIEQTLQREIVVRDKRQIVQLAGLTYSESIR